MPDANVPVTRKLVLIDGNSLLYRGFFAMRALTTSAGQPTNAVFSFTMMLLTLLDDQKPDVLLCAWDKQGSKTFRHEEFKEYKGTRQTTPPELVEQGPLARELVQAFHIPSIEAEGFEADDIIGTLTKRGREQGYEVLIVSGDLDGLQLVKPGVRVMTTVKGVTDTVIYDDEAVEKRYGLQPRQLTDYRALKGDTSDNIPGVPGVGEKTATTLLQKFDTVENLLEHLDEITPAKLQAAVTGAQEQIKQSKRLATIVTDVPLEGIDIPALDAAPHQPDWSKVRALFERLEFRTLMRRLPKGSGDEGEKAPPAPNNGGARGENAATTSGSPIIGGGGGLDSPDYDPFAEDTDETAAAAPPEPAAVVPADYHDVDPTDADALAQMAEAVRRAYRVGVCLHTSGEGLLDARLYGVALAVGEGTVFYVPMITEPAPPQPAAAPPVNPNAIASLFDEPATAQETLPAPSGEAAGDITVPDTLVTLLEDAKINKVAHDSKTAIALLERAGVKLNGVVFDTELAAYLLNAGRRASFPLHEVASDYASRELRVLDKKERKAMEPDAIQAHEKAETIKAADALLATMGVQEPRLAAEGLTKVMQDLDLPISPIVAEMELAGLAVDVEALHRMARDLQTRVESLELDIYQLAGTEFTIGSTKQLQEILFERLKLPSGKKTKTGYSTDADTLEELAPNYPIVGKILQHRGLIKLKNTYADAMPLLVRSDGRLHTSLNQTVASTGRLSSSNPNLQNIPIRTEIGREIRRAFIAPDGNVLVSADYSQIELRIFAHVTEDQALVEAFESGEDIHKYTAGKMYNVPVDEVTADMRRAAKTVNYAVIYGISEFALGRRLGISMSAAKELKTSYLDRFPGVREYIDKTVAFAREKGYVQTLFGRRRYMPDINSRVFQFRQAAERAAANMPIQGSSADIMKLAMQAVYAMLKKEGFQAKMLLQVHDELLFEAPPEEVPALAVQVREKMSGVYPLRVMLEADVKTGKTWADVTPVADPAASLDGEEGA